MNWLQTIHHDGSARYAQQVAGKAILRVRADRTAPIRQLFVRSAPDGEQRLTALHRAADDAACQWWQIELPRAMPRDGYRFFLITSAGDYWLSAAGLTHHTPTDATDFKLIAEASLPHWVRDAVFYQIFPDRFCDGDLSNNVQTGEYQVNGRSVVARGWHELPDRNQGSYEFFGGDLQGISQRLDYLAELGITAIYLTPIFTSPSSHKYDSVSYEQVDQHFGGDAALIALREALDERGMRLILDLVPNHSGDQHPWFRAALADKYAPEAEFYTFHHHPHGYEKWLGVATLPKLNYRSQRLREVMYAGDDSIVRRWLRPPFRIDGWRLDVANMLARQGETQLGHKIGRGIRRAVKQENPQAYLLGENFFDGTPHLQGDELDACMNYRGFDIPLQLWLASDHFAKIASPSDRRPIDTATMAAQWGAFLAAIPYQIALQQFNLLGSHDTPRITTILGGNRERLRVARTLLYAFPGVPCVYYGDEIGLEGGEDPDNRRPMPWDEAAWNQEVLAFEKQLIQLRRRSPALRWGGYQLLHAEAETIAFLRDAPEEQIIVVARRAADGSTALDVRAAGIADGTTLRELLGGANATVSNGLLALDGLAAVGIQLWQA